MNTTVNWALIDSGEKFQALVNHLVIFDDPKARIYNRAGPDGGQDAKSGDGATIFQAKHH